MEPLALSSSLGLKLLELHAALRKSWLLANSNAHNYRGALLDSSGHSEGPGTRPVSEGQPKSLISTTSRDVHGYARESRAGSRRTGGRSAVVKSAPCCFHRPDSKFCPWNQTFYKWGNRGPEKGGGLPRTPVSWRQRRSSCLHDLSCSTWRETRVSPRFKPRHLPRLGELFLPPPGAARTPAPCPTEHLHPRCHPQTLGRRRKAAPRGRAEAGTCTRASWGRAGSPDARPARTRPGPPGLPPGHRRGGPGRRAPSQGHAHRAARARASGSGPRDPTPQPRRQPEEAAIYRGSHAQSLLAAAATAEYFAQIWLGPRREGREPREREGDPRPGGGLTGP